MLRLALVQLCKLQSSLAKGLHRNTICRFLNVIPVSMGLETAGGVVTKRTERNPLYGMALRCDCLSFVEYFAVDFIMEDEERCLRCTAMCVEDGSIHRFGAHSAILVMGGYGRCYLVHVCTHPHWRWRRCGIRQVSSLQIASSRGVVEEEETFCETARVNPSWPTTFSMPRILTFEGRGVTWSAKKLMVELSATVGQVHPTGLVKPDDFDSKMKFRGRVFNTYRKLFFHRIGKAEQRDRRDVQEQTSIPPDM